MKIAILGDDPKQTDLVYDVLAASGHICSLFHSGKALLNQLEGETYEMLILDWQVSDLSGSEILRWVRNKLPSVLPVLFITSRSGEDDILEGLAAGANDYMIKPIRRSELVVRVQALLRRAYPLQRTSGQIVFGDYLFDTRAGRVSIAGKRIETSQKEFDLALLLFGNIDRPLSRAYILEEVWSRDINIPSRTLDTHVSRVRSKLKLQGGGNSYQLAPVYSYGYRLEKLI